MSRKAVISLATGLEDPEKVTVAFLARAPLADFEAIAPRYTVFRVVPASPR